MRQRDPCQGTRFAFWNIVTTTEATGRNEPRAAHPIAYGSTLCGGLRVMADHGQFGQGTYGGRQLTRRPFPTITTEWTSRAGMEQAQATDNLPRSWWGQMHGKRELLLRNKPMRHFASAAPD